MLRYLVCEDRARRAFFRAHGPRRPFLSRSFQRFQLPAFMLQACGITSEFGYFLSILPSSYFIDDYL